MAKKRVKLSEESLAEIVVAHLESMGADIYQEVTVPGGVADIVAKIAAEYWIIETKASLSLALLCQAMERRRLAHRVFVAAPRTKHIRDVGVLCKELGVGLWEVYVPKSSYDVPRVNELIPSSRWNTRPVDLANRLQAEHKTHAKAGSVSGGRWTPWRNTCEQLIKIITASPGIPLKQAITKIKHHYSCDKSAIGSMSHWILKGKVKGIKIVKNKLGKSECWPV